MKLNWSWICCVLLATVFAGQQPVSSAEPGDTPSTIPPAAATGRHAVPQQHLRLLGSRERLKELARERGEAYQRVVRVAREQDADEHAKMVSLALVAAIEEDEALGKRAVDMAMKTVGGPIKRGHVTGNDGGQSHAWPHHNGAVVDPAAWHKDRAIYETGKILAFEDAGNYVYVAGDATRAYSPKKLKCFTRQIVYIRPDTFIVFDRVVSRHPEFKKSWLLQAISRPEGTAPNLTITSGKGRLFIQTVLPRDPEVRLAEGPELYAYDGKTYPAARDTGAAPVCRIMISPSKPAEADYFLHVLTAKDSSSNDPVPKAVARETESDIRITVGGATVTFQKHEVGGYIELTGQRRRLPDNHR